jgi:hypothetical protein
LVLGFQELLVSFQPDLLELGWMARFAFPS